MPLRVEYHTAPYLKALIRCIEHTRGHGQASIFRWQKSYWKALILLHKQTKWQIHLTVFVDLIWNFVIFRSNSSYANMDPSSEADYSGNSSSATIKPVSLASKFDCFSDSDWRKLNDNNNYFIRVYQSLIKETDITNRSCRFIPKRWKALCVSSFSERFVPHFTAPKRRLLGSKLTPPSPKWSH